MQQSESYLQKPVCAVFDRLTALYDTPFVIRHTGEAMRQFADLKKDTTNRFGKNPEDFTLFQLGWFNESTGKHTNLDSPVQLG